MASHPGESMDSRYDRDAINSVTNQHPVKSSRPICLGRFLNQQTAAEAIQQTADYARDPQTYLEANIGNTALQQRKQLLSIPEKVERDYYGIGRHKQPFETHIAKVFGKEYGLFFVTGIQAQLAALKTYCSRAGKNKVAWHVTSHLEKAEDAAYKELYGLDRTLLGSDPDNLPSVDEIKSVLSLPENDRPTAVLIEIPNREIGCQTYTYPELQAISSACREAGVKLHMDGARIWEIEPFYQRNAGKSFAEIAQLFDSVYVSFYKGLRGVAGAMLLASDSDLIEQAKKWQWRAGGRPFQLTYEVVDCERGYNENIGTFAEKWRKMEEVVDGVTEATSKFKTDEGGSIIEFWPEKATCCQIRTAFGGFTNDEFIAARDRVEEKMNVRVFERLFIDSRQRRGESSASAGAERGKEAQAEIPKTAEMEAGKKDETRHMIEWMIVGGTLNVETKVFVDAYVLLCEELLAARKG